MRIDATEFQIVLNERAISGLSSSSAVIDYLTTLAQAGEAVAKDHAPVDTGNLRRSITHEVINDKKNPYARVGTNVRYGIFQELGTRFHPAQPFMRPAIEAVKRLLRG